MEMAEEKNMSFLEHLEELRKRLFRAVLFAVAGVVVVFIFDTYVIENIIMAPRRADFPTYRFFCWLGHNLGLEEQLCFSDANFTLQSTTMGGNFSAYMTVVLIGGVILAFPAIFYQIWAFVRPGLKKTELKSLLCVLVILSGRAIRLLRFDTALHSVFRKFCFRRC